MLIGKIPFERNPGKYTSLSQGSEDSTVKSIFIHESSDGSELLCKIKKYDLLSY